MEDKSSNADLPKKKSHNELHHTTPSENLAISSVGEGLSVEVVERVHSFKKNSSVNDVAKKGSENAVKDTENKDSDLKSTKPKSPLVSNSAAPTSQRPKTVCDPTHSDVFPKEDSNMMGAAAIFSVNGSQSRKVYHQRERLPNNVFPTDDYPPVETPESKMDRYRKRLEQNRPTSCSIRNPLTGMGLTSNDEYKFKTSKRRDGNPLLGVGYTESPRNTYTSRKIPPGGFAHKLW